MRFIPQVEPLISRREADAARDYLLSGGWLTEFRKTAVFEERIAAAVGVPHCVATPSGTTALYLALLACGIGPGDKVIVPNYTMIASPNVVRWVGAEVVLADIDPGTMCMNMDSIPEVDGPVRALMYVAINGRAGDMRRVRRFCRDHGLILVEDACQAMGSATPEGEYLGSIGDVGCFSFSPHKIITTGQGGAVLTHDAGLAGRARKLKDFHRTAPATDRHDGLGFNFKFTDLQAVVGLEQMKAMDWRMRRKREIYRAYLDRLGELEAVTFLPCDLGHVVPWFVDILLPSREIRDALRSRLREAGIGSRPFYPPVSHQPMYGGSAGRGTYPVSEDMAGRGLWLPSSIGLETGEIDRVCAVIRGFFGGSAM